MGVERKMKRKGFSVWPKAETVVMTSLAVQWLRLHASTARGTGSIPGWGTKITQAAQHGQKQKTKLRWWSATHSSTAA